MATVVVLAEAVRGSLAFGHVGDAAPTPFSMAAGPARTFLISFPSADWVNPAKVSTLTMDVVLERSLDSGVTWVGFGGFGGGRNDPGKSGNANTPSISVPWDGLAMLLRGSVTVGPATFSWGVSVT